jgi:hypothetical protein
MPGVASATLAGSFAMAGAAAKCHLQTSLHGLGLT